MRMLDISHHLGLHQEAGPASLQFKVEAVRVLLATSSSGLHKETVPQVRREIFGHLEGQVLRSRLVTGQNILDWLGQVVAPGTVVVSQVRLSDLGHQLRGTLLETVQQWPALK